MIHIISIRIHHPDLLYFKTYLNAACYLFYRKITIKKKKKLLNYCFAKCVYKETDFNLAELQHITFKTFG